MLLAVQPLENKTVFKITYKTVPRRQIEMATLASETSRLTANGERKRKLPQNSRKPKHQNSFAFKHNRNSKKTAAIKNVMHDGLCQRCHEKIMWKKKYRKYKPIKKSRKCNNCQELVVKRAYHTLCKTCATSKNVCAWCAKPNEIVKSIAERTIINRKNEEDVEEALKFVKERKRRTLMRKYDRGDMHAKEIIQSVDKIVAEEQEKRKGKNGGFDDFDDFGMEF
jgi:hypothetical protein